MHLKPYYQVFAELKSEQCEWEINSIFKKLIGDSPYKLLSVSLFLFRK